MTTTEIPARGDHEADLPAEVVPVPSTAQTAVDAEIVWIDPRELIIGDNVRTAVELERGFVADIKDRGVRQIIPVRRDESGRLVVQTGQKRVLAAIEAGLDRVRVIIETPVLTDERDRMVDRILDQLGENEHRSAISDAEEARATQQLLGLGLTAGQIARRRHIPAKRVKTAAAVAHNEVAMDAVAEGLLDLAQAAVVAEFSDDQTAVLALRTAASTRPEQFDHITQQLRDDREETRLRGADHRAHRTGCDGHRPAGHPVRRQDPQARGAARRPGHHPGHRADHRRARLLSRARRIPREPGFLAADARASRHRVGVHRFHRPPPRRALHRARGDHHWQDHRPDDRGAKSRPARDRREQ